MYYIADVCFNSSARASELKKTVQEYNQWLIQRWNSKVAENEQIFVFGTLFSSLEYTTSILQKLNGKIYLILSKDTAKQFSIEEWKAMGITPWRCQPFVKKNLEQLSPYNFYLIAERDMKEVKDEKDIFYYCYYTIKEQKGSPIENRWVNLSCSKWNYEPIKIDDIPKIISNLLEWEVS